MTAAYGLPDHLIDLVGAAITEIAVNVIDRRTDPDLYELAWEWSDRVCEGDHEGLLTAQDAAQLQELIDPCVVSVFTTPNPYRLDLELATHATELIEWLRDVADSARMAA